MPHNIMTKYQRICSNAFKMQALLDSGLHSIDRCISAQSVWIVGGGTDSPFFLMGSNSSNMLPLRKASLTKEA